MVEEILQHALGSDFEDIPGSSTKLGKGVLTQTALVGRWGRRLYSSEGHAFALQLSAA